MDSLIERLKKVKDFRQGQGKRHPLWWILLIVILGVMNGHLGYRALGDFAQFNRENLTLYFGMRGQGVPSYSTIRRALMGVDFAILIDIFNQWAVQLVGDDLSKMWLSLDGKSIRSTVEYYRQNRQNFVSIVSIFARESQLVLSLSPMENKQMSEIHVVRDLVENLPLTGCVLTLDALHCQKETVNTIVANGHDYAIAVKKNQQNLYRSIEAIANLSKPITEDVTLDEGHGRTIQRRVSVFPLTEEVKSTWRNSQCCIRVERQGTRNKEDYYHLAYYLSSRLETAAVFARGIQGHWGIENQLHWPKDVVLKEDSSPIHQFQPATNLSVLKTIGMNLFRFLGFSSITEGQRWLAHRIGRLVALI